jgi:hypothetical protein
MSKFDHIVLPAQCNCGEAVLYASLGQLASGPVELECPRCGVAHRIDVGADAERLRMALSQRFNGDTETGACSMLAEPDRS